MSRPRASSLVLGCLCAATLGAFAARAQTVLPSTFLHDSGIGDEDDMCFWLHPSNLSLSTVIVSDKAANKLFVYDLQGATIQTVTAAQPGNIDVRYNFPLGGEPVDIVALNERTTSKLRVYRVNPVTRQLTQVDDGNINTGSNYGFTLYRSPTSGKYYGFTGPSSSTIVKQWELVDNGAGRIAGVGPLRQFGPGTTVEGMVADDETGRIYLSQESAGVLEYSAEPTGGTAGNLIASVGQNGLTADVEGITIYYRASGAGYLIVSSQGSSTFKVYARQAPHAYVGTFSVQGVTQTDGCDVINLPLNDTFAAGAFVCHNGSTSPYPDELVKFGDIAGALGLTVDNQYWDPRQQGATGVEPSAFAAAGLVLHASPNPMGRQALLGFSLPRAGRMRLAILDVAGRELRRLHDGDAAAGPGGVAWDGRDDRGERVRPGVYLARLDVDGAAAVTGKVVVVDH